MSSAQSTADPAHIINAADYHAERFNPLPDQTSYLHLSDLRLALETIRTDAKVLLLDYGCGGSPYAQLFPNAEYKRADYLQTWRLDYVLGADARVPERDEAFDIVLSTQVLEHVAQPEVYLSECRRLLKPGGTLILTTHGIYPDHGCPYDYHRWTADGLSLALKDNKLQVIDLKKLTSGPRALFFLLGISLDSLRAPRGTPFGLGLQIMRLILSHARSWVHRNCDRYFTQHRLSNPVPGENGSLYITLFAVARKV